MIRLLAGAAILLAVSGCEMMGGSPSAELVKALAADQNAVCWRVNTPWGSSSLDRNWGCEAPPAKIVTAP